jgi:SAM-dependent methyltransferase
MPVIVLGMHRSGTSALTRLIHLLGLSVGRSDDLMSPQPDNPMGFWESRSLSELNDRLLAAVDSRWWLPPRQRAHLWQSDGVVAQHAEAQRLLQDVYGSGQQWVWKDPRNCLTLSFWLELLPEPPAIVFIHRHPLEVITSLRQRNELPPLVAAGLWEIYNRSAIEQMAGLPAFVLSYEQLLDAPTQVLRRLSGFLADQGMQVDRAPDVLEVQRLVALQLRHYRFGEIDLLDEQLNTHQRALYEYLRRLPEQCRRFAADELPAASPLTYAVLDQYAAAGKQVEEAGKRVADAEKRVAEAHRHAAEAEQRAADARRERDAVAEELQSTRATLATVQAEAERDRDRARRELADVKQYYQQRRFRLAERANGLLGKVPGARAVLRVSADAAARTLRLLRRTARPVTTVVAAGEPDRPSASPPCERLEADPVPGNRDYRAFVGPPKKYDVIAAMQFNLLTSLGLREHHYLLDIGCGSLRGGRLLIPYLLPGHYCGIEPEQWLVEHGIANELGTDLVRIKQPRFDYNGDFRLSVFDEKFDFVLAQSVFSHAAPQQIDACLAEIPQVMQSTGTFAATFFEGDENYAGTDWVYPGRVTYTLEHLEARAAQHGLVCRKIDWPHPSGQTWVLFGRAADALPEVLGCGVHRPHEMRPPHTRIVESAVQREPAQECE